MGLGQLWKTEQRLPQTRREGTLMSGSRINRNLQSAVTGSHSRESPVARVRCPPEESGVGGCWQAGSQETSQDVAKVLRKTAASKWEWRSRPRGTKEP